MFVGHIGAGLLLKRFEPRLNLGALLFAALFADLLLWALVLFGIETVGVPETAGSARFFTFVFPYSHGLAASVIWSGLAALTISFFAVRGSRLAWAAALAASSHFMLDLLVHIPELPVIGQGSLKLGLGLWRHMPIALVLELVLAAIALVLYLNSIQLSRARALLLGGIVTVTALLTVIGPYIPGELPPPAALALSSLLMVIVVVSLGFVVEGRFSVMAPR